MGTMMGCQFSRFFIIQDFSIFCLKKMNIQFSMNHFEMKSIFSLIEKGVEYMVLVTPNQTVGINGYTLFFKLSKGWMSQ
jgi:hypothetical protein